MAYNYRPIFTNVPVISGSVFATTGTISKELTSLSATATSGGPFNSGNLNNSNLFLVYTATQPEGAYVQRIRFRPRGTNTASVARIFINNGDVLTTAANSTLYDELSLPATTNSEVSAMPVYELPLNFALPYNYRIYVTLATTAAAGYDITVFGGNYNSV